VRFLTAGTAAVLVEVDEPEQVDGLYAALAESPVREWSTSSRRSHRARHVRPRDQHRGAPRGSDRRAPAVRHRASDGHVVEILVSYDGEDLAEVARSTGSAP